MTGAELKQRRLNLGLSQEALAKLLGTTQNTIARNERGNSPIQNPVMMDLAMKANGSALARRVFNMRSLEMVLEIWSNNGKKSTTTT